VPLGRFRIGSFDYYSGLDMASLSVKAEFEVGSCAPGTELPAAFQFTGDQVWEMDLVKAITQLERGTLAVI